MKRKRRTRRNRRTRRTGMSLTSFVWLMLGAVLALGYALP